MAPDPLLAWVAPGHETISVWCTSERKRFYHRFYHETIPALVNTNVSIGWHETISALVAL